MLPCCSRRFNLPRSLRVKPTGTWRYFLLIILTTVFYSFVQPAYCANNLLNDINVVDTEVGYDLVIQYFSPLFYESHTPLDEGKKLDIQMRQSVLDNAGVDTVTDNQSNITWDEAFGVPLVDVTLMDIHSDSPRLILRFSKKVKYKIHSGGDSRSITISITTDRPPFKGIAPIEPERGVPLNLITALKVVDPNMANRLDRANNAILEKDYSRAVQLFTRIREEGNEAIKPHIQELMGIAREYNGQLAHAKAEYQKYLQDFPSGAAAERVKQRLLGLTTAADQPKVSREKKKANKHQKRSTWRSQYYGDVGQFYSRYERKLPHQDMEVVRSDLINYFSLMARTNNSTYDFKAQISGSYLEDLLPDGDRNQFYPNRVAIDARQKDWGLYARLGRQTRRSGGVLGRFDGIHAAYDLNPIFTLNLVAGYPMDYVERDKINSDQSFYGASLDIGSLWEGWEFSTFYIAQDYQDIRDRESVGGEIQYFDTKKSFFSLVDYDIFHSDLNMLLSHGHWAISAHTTLNYSYDQRRSPILLTTNAIQGQGVAHLEDLFTVYSLDEILQLARDRSAEMQSLNLGVTQKLNSTWQIDINTLMTKYEDTTASTNVAAIAEDDLSYYYSARLIGSTLFGENDSLLLGLRYADTVRTQVSSIETYYRLNLTTKLRLNPRVRFDYRQSLTNNGERWTARPSLKVDYKLNRKVRCELDFGYDWMQENFAAQNQFYSGYYLRAGYWLQF